MKSGNKNPLNMIRDPFAGDSFVLPETLCTKERRLFFHRMNEILAFLYVTTLSLNEFKKNNEKLIPELPFKESTPFRIGLTGGNLIITANRAIKLTKEGIDILTRQIFVMIYGSFETYLFQIFERSYPQIGITKNTLDHSLDILMKKKKWDSKFCKMSEVFNVNYKASKLINHFSGFYMNFEGTTFKDPLQFLDELVQIRHKIVHASSILEKDKIIFLDIKEINVFFAFCFLLTDYIDGLFAQRFGYKRLNLEPAKA